MRSQFGIAVSMTVGLMLVSSCVAATLPEVYTERESCPNLSCTCSEWTAKQNSSLFKEPASTMISGKLEKGEKLTGLVGEVRVRPIKVTITKEHKEGNRLFKPGDELFLLQYLYEGIFKGWQSGATFEVYGIGIAGLDNFVRPPEAAERWAEVKDKYSNDRWVQVKSKSGQIGWLHESDLVFPDDESKCAGN